MQHLPRSRARLHRREADLDRDRGPGRSAQCTDNPERPLQQDPILGRPGEDAGGAGGTPDRQIRSRWGSPAWTLPWPGSRPSRNTRTAFGPCSVARPTGPTCCAPTSGRRCRLVRPSITSSPATRRPSMTPRSEAGSSSTPVAAATSATHCRRTSGTPRTSWTTIEEAGVEPHLGEGLHQPRLRQRGAGGVRLHQEVGSYGPLEADRRLEDQRRAPPKLEWVERRDVAILETDATLRRLHKAVQAAEKSRFSRTDGPTSVSEAPRSTSNETSVRIGTAACPGPAGYSSDTWST